MEDIARNQTQKKTGASTVTRFVEEATSVHFSLVVGYALCQLWLSLCFFAPQLFPDNASVFVYELSLVVCVVSLVPCLLFSRRSERILEDNRTVWALAACAGVGTLLIPFSAGSSTEAVVLQVAAALLTGIPSGWLFVGWYQAFCKIDDLAGFVLGVVVSSLFMYVLTAVALAPILSPWVMVGIACVTPLVSGLLLTRAPRRDDYVSEAAFPEKGTEQRRALILLCLGIFTVSLADEFMRNFYLEGTDLMFYSSGLNLVLLLAKLLCTVVLVSMLTSQIHHMPLVYRASFLLAMIAVLFMPYTQHVTTLFYGITNFGAFLFKIMVMIIAFNFCHRYRTIPVLVFALTRIAFSLDLLIGFGAYHAYRSFSPIMPDLLGLLSVALGLLIIATYLFVFADRSSSSLFLKAEGEAASSDSMRDACDRLVRIGRLSKREAEVLALIAKGRSAPRIQSELHVSMNTVNSHTSHIYQKLKVHSRQELLDLIEETAPQESAT